MIRYYAGDDVTAPEAVECDPPGWPHLDAKDRQQFENTHFDNIDDAWEHIEESSAARINLAAYSVRNARERMAKAEREAADAVVWAQSVRTARAEHTRDVLLDGVEKAKKARG